MPGSEGLGTAASQFIIFYGFFFLKGAGARKHMKGCGPFICKRQRPLQGWGSQERHCSALELLRAGEAAGSLPHPACPCASQPQQAPGLVLLARDRQGLGNIPHKMLARKTAAVRAAGRMWAAPECWEAWSADIQGQADPGKGCADPAPHSLCSDCISGLCCSPLI